MRCLALGSPLRLSIQLPLRDMLYIELQTLISHTALPCRQYRPLLCSLLRGYPETCLGKKVELMDS
jgi:hypothetical protein